jgi:hypothetical protein
MPCEAANGTFAGAEASCATSEAALAVTDGVCSLSEDPLSSSEGPWSSFHAAFGPAAASFAGARTSLASVHGSWALPEATWVATLAAVASRDGAVAGADRMKYEGPSMSRRAVVGLTLLVVALLAACGLMRSSSPPRSEEEKLRADLAIPADVALVSLETKPSAGGTFGREGLRIVARFKPTPAQAAAYRGHVASLPGWAPLPLPSRIDSFREPPIEVSAAGPRGLAFCQVSIYHSGAPWETLPCASAPVRFDQYRIAVLDEDTSELVVVYKNYY